MTAKEQALELYRIHTFYWSQPKLISQQQLILQVASIVRALEKYNIVDTDYWEEVKNEIYKLHS